MIVAKRFRGLYTIRRFSAILVSPIFAVFGGCGHCLRSENPRACAFMADLCDFENEMIPKKPHGDGPSNIYSGNIDDFPDEYSTAAEPFGPSRLHPMVFLKDQRCCDAIRKEIDGPLSVGKDGIRPLGAIPVGSEMARNKKKGESYHGSKMERAPSCQSETVCPWGFGPV